MNIVLSIGYYPLYLEDVDAKFVDKLIKGIRVEKDWKMDRYYETSSQNIDVYIVKDKPLTHTEWLKISAERDQERDALIAAEAVKNQKTPVTE